MKKGLKVVLVLFWLIFLAVGVLIYGYSYIVPRINGALTKTAVVNYGELTNHDEVNALIVRDESVIFSTEAGELSYYAAETEKTRKDTKVLDVYPAGKKSIGYYAEKTGFVSYYYDGFERRYTPDKIADLKAEDIMVLSIEPQDITRQSTEYLKPLYKILNSDVWYIVFPIHQSRIGLYKPGNKVTVDFSDGEVPATVDSIIGSGEYKLVSVYTKKFYANFAKLRTAQVKVINQDFKGLIVPNTAITCDENNCPGVYVKNINEEFVFTKIDILVETEEESLITPDSFTEVDADGKETKVKSVEIYDEILRNVQ